MKKQKGIKEDASTTKADREVNLDNDATFHAVIKMKDGVIYHAVNHKKITTQELAGLICELETMKLEMVMEYHMITRHRETPLYNVVKKS